MRGNVKCGLEKIMKGFVNLIYIFIQDKIQHFFYRVLVHLLVKSLIKLKALKLFSTKFKKKSMELLKNKLFWKLNLIWFIFRATDVAFKNFLKKALNINFIKLGLKLRELFSQYSNHRKPKLGKIFNKYFQT